MKTRFTSLAILLTSVILVADCAFGYETRIEGLNVGPVDLVSAKEDGWAFAVRGERVSEGICELTIGLTRPSEAVPPAFSVSFGLPQKDAHHKWTGGPENVTLPPEWGGHTESRLCSGLPVVSFVNDDDRNRILVAASDAKRKIGISAGLREEDCITLRASGANRLTNPKDCAFVTIANCNLSSSCNAIRLGVGEGRIHDATFSNLVISDTAYAINFVAAYVKGNRGTDITDVRFSNLRIAARQFLWMHHGYSTESIFSNIVFDGISGTVEKPSLIDMNPAMPAKDIRFINVEVPKGVKVVNADASFCRGTIDEIK